MLELATGHLITHISARSVVTGSQRNGRTSAQLALDIFGGIRDVWQDAWYVMLIRRRSARASLASANRLWLALYGVGFVLLAAAAVALLYFDSYPAFFGLAVAWVLVYVASVILRRRALKPQTNL